MSKTGKKSQARERIVETADRLFYSEGVNSVGIDRIIAEAGVAKMTLYNHFASKDELIVAVLQHRDAVVFKLFKAQMEASSSRKGGRLAGFFTALKKWFASPGFRGCVFINTVAEVSQPDHPAVLYAADHKERFNRLLADAIKQQVPAASAATIDAIALLVEGAVVMAVMQRSSKPADTARKAAQALLGDAWNAA